jgi:hypothetical protein
MRSFEYEDIHKDKVEYNEMPRNTTKNQDLEDSFKQSE